MKNHLMTILFSLMLCSLSFAENKLNYISKSIYKIDAIKPDQGIVYSGSAFCIDIKQEDGGWRVTLMTCNHIAKYYEHKFGVADNNIQLIAHRFYPVQESFVIDKLNMGKSNGDTCTISYLVVRKPTATVLKQSSVEPQPGEMLLGYGCPGGKWANITIYHLLSYEYNRITMIPHSPSGASGSPIINSRGEYIGVISQTNANVTVGEGLLLKKK